jgi:PASTA domain
MTARSAPAWVLVATLALLLAATGASVASEQAGAAICTKNCPPAEEEPSETPESDPEPTPGPYTYSVLLINGGWGNGTANGDAPLKPSLLPEYVSYLGEHMNEWFAQSVPPGRKERGWVIRSGGSYTIPRPTLPADPSHCTDDQLNLFFQSLNASARRSAESAGLSPGRYDLVVVDTSKAVCGHGGKAGGSSIWISRPTYAMREIGRYFGLTPAEGLTCTNASGQPVTLSNQCKEVDHRDPYDTMGYENTLSYDAIHTNQLGWLGGQFIDLRAPETGTFTLRPFTAVPHGTRAIRLQDGPTRLWVEYRRPVGIDDPQFMGQNFPAEWGVVVHREVSIDGKTVSQLLDMTPGDEGDFNSSPLEGTWANPLGETTITVDTTGPNAAIVTIGNQRTNRVPSIVGFTPTRAEEVLRQAGLVSGGWEGKPDIYCASLGLVMGQFPYAGEMVRPGTPIRFTVGEEDAQQGCL